MTTDIYCAGLGARTRCDTLRDIMFRPIYANKMAKQQHAVAQKRTQDVGFNSQLQAAQTTKPKSRTHYPKSIPMPAAAKVSLKHAQRIANYAPMIMDSAARHNVPIALICGVMIQESGVNPKAKSHAGATGLMQLMPATAKRMGVTQIWDPQQNIEGGTKYLGYLLNYFDGDIQKTIAAYNAGEGNVKKYGGIPPFKETQGYVPRVLAYTKTVQGILGAQQPAMRQTVQSTMPRHAIANFTQTVTGGPDAEPRIPSTRNMAQRLARI